MALSTVEVLNGTFNLIVVSVSIILGLTVLFKYFKNQNKNFILMGLTLCFISSGWYGTSVSFIVALLLNNDGLPIELILLLNFIPLPIGLFAWVGFYTNLLAKNRKKLFFGFLIIVTAVFYFLFLSILIIDVDAVAQKISAVDTAGTNWTLLIYIIIYIVIFVTTGMHFSIQTMQHENPETQLKGKFLFLAFPSFSIGAFLDASMPTNPITLIIFRLILLTSILCFYNGFLLPNWVKKRLLKN